MSWTSYNGPHQVPFWEFIHSLDPNHPSNAGVGVDRSQAPQTGPGPVPPFGPGVFFGPAGFHAWRGGWGPHHRGRRGCGEGFGPRMSRQGCRGRHCRRGAPPNPEDPSADQERDVNERTAENEKEDTPGTMRDDAPNHPNPPADDGPGHHHPHHRPGPPPPPPPYGAGPHPFDFRAMMQAFANHPFAQQLREYVQNTRAGAAGANNDYGDDTFVPPVDIFNTETHWTIHIGLPGAKKEDIGVNWDAEKSQLAISGVVYRPGDEEFLQGLVAGERKVGMFERNVRLPPEGGNEKDEVDVEGITAKMEDGLLIVVVPKVERDWTEVRKVDIE